MNSTKNTTNRQNRQKSVATRQKNATSRQGLVTNQKKSTKKGKKTHNPQMRIYRKQMLGLAEGLFSKTVDMMLWTLAFSGEMMLPESRYIRYDAAYQAAYHADRFVQNVNYDVLKNALVTAKRYGWIQASGKRGRKAPIAITKAGKRRLESIMPVYDDKRVWDKRMHLVTYDIAEKRRKDRNLLRHYLMKLGCGMLQESVWITPYNPIGTLSEFVSKRRLHGAIIVSDIGSDGSIGDETLESLIIRVYRLKELNEKYQKILDSIKTEGVIDSLSVVQFLAVLRLDPQLPFELYPSWWVGDEVYKNVKHLLKMKRK